MSQLKRLRNAPSPALMIAFIALLGTLGGVGYAANAIKKNSVGAKHIKDGAVGSAEVKDGSLGASDFGGPLTTFVMRQGPNAEIPGNGFAKAEAACNQGERATGGGVYNEANVDLMTITSSYPTPNPTSPPATGNGQAPTGWRVWMKSTVGAPRTVNAYVICAS